jgi:hypothetical protein
MAILNIRSNWSVKGIPFFFSEENASKQKLSKGQKAVSTEHAIYHAEINQWDILLHSCIHICFQCNTYTVLHSAIILYQFSKIHASISLLLYLKSLSHQL